jgi:AcrR family transcriptional regulator
MSGTPRRELARLEKQRRDDSDQRRAELEAAALRGCAELGYANLTVQAVLERAGASRSRFYREFDNLDACYASAYAKEIELVSERLLSGCERDWEEGLDRALRILQELVEGNPLLARALFVEVHVAGEPAIAKKEEVWERLSHALDGARRETTKPRHSPPPLAASFMLSAIECAVCSFVLDGKKADFGPTVSALRDLIVETYRGA